MGLLWLFKKKQVESSTERPSCCSLIANSVSHAAEGNGLNFEAVTLTPSKTKELWFLLPPETSLDSTEL